MKKLILLVLMVTFMTGCAGTWRNSAGDLMPQKDDFECNQQCGYYDSRSQNVFMMAQCLAACRNSRGYYSVRE